MKTVFIAGPYAGLTHQHTEENVRRVTELAAFAVRQGLAPIVPHLHGMAGIYGVSTDDGTSGEARIRALECSVAIVRAVARADGLLWVLLTDDGLCTGGVAEEVRAWPPSAHGPVAGTWADWCRQAGVVYFDEPGDVDIVGPRMRRPMGGPL